MKNTSASKGFYFVISDCEKGAGCKPRSASGRGPTDCDPAHVNRLAKWGWGMVQGGPIMKHHTLSREVYHTD